MFRYHQSLFLQNCHQHMTIHRKPVFITKDLPNWDRTFSNKPLRGDVAQSQLGCPIAFHNEWMFAL